MGTADVGLAEVSGAGPVVSGDRQLYPGVFRDEPATQRLPLDEAPLGVQDGSGDAEGGGAGGRVVVSGTPEKVAACKASHTGRALREMLAAKR